MELVSALLDPKMKNIPAIREGIADKDVATFLHQAFESHVNSSSGDDKPVVVSAPPALKKAKVFLDR